MELSGRDDHPQGGSRLSSRLHRRDPPGQPDALLGAHEIMARHSPVMAVCAYHKCEHLWTIPQLLKTGNPGYRIFLRRYAEECWETVYYAVPPERLPVDSRTGNQT